MSAEQLIQYLSWALFLLVCVSVTLQAVRMPRRVTIDIALFFIIPSVIISFGIETVLGVVQPGPLLNSINTVLFLSMAYMLLRLVDDFSDVPAWLMRGATIALMLLAAGAFVQPLPAWLIVLMVIYLIGLLMYSTIAFARESRRSIPVPVVALTDGGVTDENPGSLYICGHAVGQFDSVIRGRDQRPAAG